MGKQKPKHVDKYNWIWDLKGWIDPLILVSIVYLPFGKYLVPIPVSLFGQIVVGFLCGIVALLVLGIICSILDETTKNFGDVSYPRIKRNTRKYKYKVFSVQYESEDGITPGVIRHFAAVKPYYFNRWGFIVDPHSPLVWNFNDVFNNYHKTYDKALEAINVYKSIVEADEIAKQREKNKNKVKQIVETDLN